MTRTPPPKYAEHAARDRLYRELPQWSVDGGHLCRVYKTADWKSAMMVANTVAHLAEAAWHHPDLGVSYGKVEVRLQTHESSGITDRDFELARKIEDVVMWQPAREGGALEGTPKNDERHAYINYGG